MATAEDMRREYHDRLARLSPKVAHELAVQGYLRSLAQVARRSLGVGIQPSEAFAVLRAARLFELHPAVADRLFGEVEAYVENKIGGEAPGEGGWAQRISEAGRVLSFPDHLPFESCYFGWGMSVPSMLGTRMLVSYAMGVADDAETVARIQHFEQTHQWGTLPPEYVRERWLFRDGLVGCWTRGYLMTDEGDCFELIENKDQRELLVLRQRLAGHRWAEPLVSYAPWVVNVLVSAVNDADTLVVEGERTFSYRRQFEALSKVLGKGRKVLPRPFYIVDVRPTTEYVRRRIQKSMPREWSHRWDVRGHWVTRVARGVLPLAEKQMRRLARRRYWVFTALRPPSGDALRVLMRHRVPTPRLDEWVAVQQVWRGFFTKGPDDKPYVPSAHRLRPPREQGMPRRRGA
jgi:hypothetical protein